MTEDENQVWEVSGAFIYQLVWDGTYRKGIAQFQNRYSVQVNCGFGTTDADAARIARQIVTDLNAVEGQRAELERVVNLLERFRDYAATLSGGSHHNPLWVEVADMLAEKEG